MAPGRDAVGWRISETWQVLHILDHVVAEGLRGRGVGAAIACRADLHRGRIDGGRDRLGVLRATDFLPREHGGEDHVTPGFVALPVVSGARIAQGWLLYDGDEAGRLGESELRGSGGVVLFGRRLNSVGVSPEAGDVEVREQDLVLRVVFFEADGEFGFFKLAVERVGLGLRLRDCQLLRVADRSNGILDRELLHELLFDTRGALQVVSGGIVHRGPGDTRNVDAAVFVESRVFGSDEGVLRERRHRIPRHLLPVLVVKLRERHLLATAETIEDVALGLRTDRDIVGKVFKEPDSVIRHLARDDDRGCEQSRDQHRCECAESHKTEDRTHQARKLRRGRRLEARISRRLWRGIGTCSEFRLGHGYPLDGRGGRLHRNRTILAATSTEKKCEVVTRSLSAGNGWGRRSTGLVEAGRGSVWCGRVFLG